MDPKKLTSGEVFVSNKIDASKLFCHTLHVDDTGWTQGPSLHVRVPSTIVIHGTLRAERVDLCQGTTVYPPLTELGGFSIDTYVQFVHPGPGFNGTYRVAPRVAMEGTLGARNGIVDINHDRVDVVQDEPSNVDPTNTDVVVRAINVDALGHITRIERIDLRRVYEGNQEDIVNLKDTFVRNTYPLYNDIRGSLGTELFLDWYRNTTEDASGESQSIDLGRFTSIALDSLTNLSTDKLFRGIIATRSGYVVFIPYECEFVLAWNVRTGVEVKNNSIGSARYAGGCLLPDDRVLLAPFDMGATVQVFDPVSNQLIQGPNLSGFWGAILHPSGHIILAAGPENNTVFLDVNTLEPKHTIPVTETRPPNFESWFSGMVIDARGRIWMVPYDHPRADVLVWELGQNTPTRIDGPLIEMNPQYRDNVSPTPIDQKRCIGGSLGYDGSVVFGSHNVLPATRFVHIEADTDDVATATVTRIPDTGDPGAIGTISDGTHGTFVLPDGRIGIVPYNSSSIQTIDPGAPEKGSSTIGVVGFNTRFSGACLLEDGRVVFCPSGVEFSLTNDNRLGFYVQPVRPPRDMVYHPFWNRA